MLQTLVEGPRRFGFDAAIAVLMRTAGRGDPGAAIRFQAATGLGFVSSEVLEVKPSSRGFTVTTGLVGLTGPGGVLPRPYTELVNIEHRRRSPALARFLDLLAQRPIAQFAGAGIKYRPHRAADAAAIGAAAPDPPQDGLRDSLLALTGHADPGIMARGEIEADPLLFYAGAFAAGPRSADRLAAMLSDWLGQIVAVEQFAGHWLDLGRDQMTALPKGGAGQFHRLGVDAAIGARAWDVQSRITLRIGPLALAGFEALLPGEALLTRLAALARLYLGDQVGFAINPVLAAAEVPKPALGKQSRLGWTSWLPISAGRRRDATEAKFSPAAAERGRTSS